MNPVIPELDALSRRLPMTRTGDARVARRCLDRVFARHALEVRGSSLDFAHQLLSLGESSISLLRYGSEAEVVAPALDFYLLQMTLSGRVGLRAQGFETVLEAGSAFIMNPNIAYRKLWDREAQQILLKIPRGRLAGRVAATLAETVEFAPETLSATTFFEPVHQLLDRLGDCTSDGSGHCRPTAAIRASENELLDLVLAALPHRLVAGRETAAGHAVPYYIWRAERHLRASPNAMVKTATLARLAGVSARTLQEGFQRFRGRTPSQIARDLRLDRARSVLLNGVGENVTAIALDCGFSHLGRFAQSYAERFGETPSQTIRRRRRS
ncbi:MULTISPECIES: AraC family transcriptional regulator [unclassified Beijerinckia]|uniref:AraC family transcriptional regulator n=1 Tax=unclassified Beijerinckia TaxID=2638183 RepID=UPI00089D7407|nr:MULTISPECIES: AraC family transcriptional regulator [unclassified Beijerinckia]MDH7799363.1 AraC-like DNA-binding protein [Beijerinckia sp. GAS462]SED47685.1 transcriptional regulator, AraC family [Beijerinckia sp. 28-YEA-48]